MGTARIAALKSELVQEANLQAIAKGDAAVQDKVYVWEETGPTAQEIEDARRLREFSARRKKLGEQVLLAHLQEEERIHEQVSSIKSGIDELANVRQKQFAHSATLHAAQLPCHPAVASLDYRHDVASRHELVRDFADKRLPTRTKFGGKEMGTVHLAGFPIPPRVASHYHSPAGCYSRVQS